MCDLVNRHKITKPVVLENRGWLTRLCYNRLRKPATAKRSVACLDPILSTDACEPKQQRRDNAKPMPSAQPHSHWARLSYYVVGERGAANPESTQASAAPKNSMRTGTPIATRLTIPSVFQGAAGSLIGSAAF